METFFQKKCQPQICPGRCTLCYFLSFYFSTLASRAAWRMGRFLSFYREEEKWSLFTSVFNSFHVKILCFLFQTSNIYGDCVYVSVLCVCVCTRAYVWVSVGGERCKRLQEENKSHPLFCNPEITTVNILGLFHDILTVC